MNKKSKYLKDEPFHGFGNEKFDLMRCLEETPLSQKRDAGRENHYSSSRLCRIYRNKLIPLRVREILWRRLRQTGLDQTWFNPFQRYWTDILKARPLWGPEDLYFLRGHYRMKFQESQVPDDASAETHEASYQRPELIYFLLHQVYKEKFVNYCFLISRALKYQPKSLSIMEYGCATAPITTSFFEFFGQAEKTEIYLADLRTFHLQYAAYKFQDYPGVKILPLLPEHGLQIVDEPRVDIIFCLTVYEHMNSPLETTRKFYNSLNLGGVFVFDYLLTDGTGLDTRSAVNQRDNTLSFIRDNFTILEGSINKAAYGETIICKKK